MFKPMLLLVLVIAGALGACSYKEEKTVTPGTAAAPPAASTTTSTKIGF